MAVRQRVTHGLNAGTGATTLTVLRERHQCKIIGGPRAGDNPAPVELAARQR